LAKFEQRLVDPDQPDAAAGRVHDDVGYPPAELLDDLQTHRLLALDPVRLLERGRVEDRPVRIRDDLRDEPTRVTDQPVDEMDLRAGDETLVPRDHRSADRDRDGGPDAGASRVRRPGRTRVPVRRQGDVTDPQFPGPRYADRRAPGLERSGGYQP